MFEYTPHMFSMLFTMATIAYSLFIAYVLLQNKDARLNRVIASCCLFMVIWSFGFASATSAVNKEAADFWYRISALGYSMIYCSFLWFIIVLTGRADVFKRKWILWLIYLPGLVFALLFSIPEFIISFDHNMVFTKYGWINQHVQEPIDLYFYIYFVSYILISIGLIFYWRFTSSKEEVHKQSNLILTVVLIALILGVLTDLLAKTLFDVTIPQIAPLVILFPLGTIMYSSVHLGLLKRESAEESSLILESEMKTILYEYLSKFIVMGGFVAFFIQYINNPFKPVPALILGIGVCFFGIAISFIVRLNISDDDKDNALVLVTGLILCFIEFGIIDITMRTLWMLPFLFIFTFMLHNNRVMLISYSVAAIIIFLEIWSIQGSVSYKLGTLDMSVRLMLLITGVIMGNIINRIYIQRLRENTIRLMGQQMVAEVSSLMLSANSKNMDEKLQECMKLIGEHFGVGRSYFFDIDENVECARFINGWWKTGRPDDIRLISKMPLKYIPWWKEELVTNYHVNIPDVEKLPQEAKAEKASLFAQGIKSSLVIAILDKENRFNYIGLDAMDEKIDWDVNHITTLKIIGNIVSDALAKNQAEKEIHELAYYDQLTGLPSRQLFRDRLEQSILLANRNSDKIVVALIDLDDFKTINDTLGHDMGDDLLVKVATRLENVVRKSDTVSRFGGDEFLIQFNGIHTPEDALVVGQEITSVFQKEFRLGLDDYLVTASTGIAIYPKDGRTTDKLIKNADIAMYHAKEKGKNAYELCDDYLKEKTYNKARLATSLYRAIEKLELYMEYQPQVVLSTGNVMGVEALIRWRHTELGNIAPSEFIGIAERNGYILELGEWIIRDVFRQIKDWENKGFNQLSVAINISFVQLRKPNFVEFIKDLIEEYGVLTSMIEFEITESIAMVSNQELTERLHELRAMGIRIAIDDFGTEYSSLGRLKDLTVDKIKIPRPFISEIPTSVKDEAIVKSIIALAKNLGIETIAEGVEEDEQLTLLREEKCDYVQGYYFYRSMDSSGIEELLEKNI